MTRPTTSSNPDTANRGGGGGREDCWSEAATEVLIEAWGDRYIQLNRGNLRQKDWKEVSDTVNARQDVVKPPKTDIQCKNRIDTLKKKYKVEKLKPPPSKWVFYHRLEYLIGAKAFADNKLTTVNLTVKSSKAKPNLSPIRSSAPTLYSGGSSRMDSDGCSMESSLGNDDDDYDLGFDERAVSKQIFETVDFSEGAIFRELARAILKFGEIYERVESSKQQQMMELEKQRMEFTKDLEFQRMNMLMDTQLELQRKKRPKYGNTSEKNT